jgi:tetratricopeptide (TPR) repeat protein
MTSTDANRAGTGGGARRVWRGTAWLAALLVLGLAGAVAASRSLEARPRALQLVPAEERLYLKGAQARRVSLAFSGIMADWYWMRSLQYVGRKAVAQEKLRIDNLSELDLKLLAPLLDTAATLDPKFMAVYEYGAVVLPTVSDADADEEAIALLKKGIAANPGAWRLYQHLGYIHWQRGDYSAAAEAYGAGSRLGGAPPWMKAMEVNMTARGSSQQTAREIYSRMREESDDPQIKVFAEYRLAQLDSLAERERISGVLSDYTRRTRGGCPGSWRDVSAQLRAAGLRVDATGAPVDPTNVPYVLVQQSCTVELHPESKIPRR